MKALTLGLIALICSNALFGQLTGKVVSILDGDTFILLTPQKKEVRIRLHGIDCPEKGQPFGQVAKSFASKAIYGKTVKVDSTDTDRYGRTIGIVLYDEPVQSLNEALLKAGLALYPV
jgi:micrococcal nuclease